MSNNPQQAIPSTNQPFVNLMQNTGVPGTITYPWYRLLLTLWNRTGGAGGDTSGLPTTITVPVNTLLTAAALNASVIIRSGPVADFSDVVDTAANYIRAHNFPISPSTNYNVFINTTAFNWTITPVNTVIFHGNLISGNFVIPANSQRTFTIEIDNIVTPAIQIFG